MTKSILCIGHASYDVFFPLDAFPEEDEKHTVEVFLDACGGPASNAAYLIGSWGGNCAFAGCLGRDVYGDRIIEEFMEIGVNLDLLEQKDDHHTPLSCIIINSSTGTRTIINRRDTKYQMKLNKETLKQMDPAYLLFDGHEYEAALEALELFPEAVSILDAGSLRPSTKDLARRVTHLLCSERFARDISGMYNGDPLYIAKVLMEINPNPGCVTLGSRGLMFWEKGEVTHIPAFPVEAVDTTGAGDIFHGAFLYYIAQGEEFYHCLRHASAAAALSTTRAGGRQSIPSRERVEKFLLSQEI